MIKFEIPGTPPSVNALYQVNRHTGEWTLKQDAVLWRMGAQAYIPKATEDYGKKKLKLLMDVHRDWWHGNGVMLKADVSNLEKLVHDTIARKMGFDDSQIWEKRARKMQSVSWEGIRIELSII